MIQVAEWTIHSLLLTLLVNGQKLSKATGFLVIHDNVPHLMTNWHVLSGRNPLTSNPLSPTAATPDSVLISHNSADGLGQWVDRVEPLLDADGRPLWLQHPERGQQVDAAALPCTNIDGIAWYAYDPYTVNESIFISVGERLSVIGFPFGTTVGGRLPIWTQGFVASEPEIDFENLPCFLIDSRTREGQSGSPIIFYSANGQYPSAVGVMTLGMTQTATRFMGIYSGRINRESDLGRVWRPTAVQRILSAGVRPAAM